MQKCAISRLDEELENLTRAELEAKFNVDIAKSQLNSIMRRIRSLKERLGRLKEGQLEMCIDVRETPELS